MFLVLLSPCQEDVDPSIASVQVKLTVSACPMGTFNLTPRFSQTTEAIVAFA
jgi:hypothetical protein